MKKLCVNDGICESVSKRESVCEKMCIPKKRYRRSIKKYMENYGWDKGQKLLVKNGI